MSSPGWNHKKRVLRAEAQKAAAEALAGRDREQIDAFSLERDKFALLVADLENNRKRISALPSGSEARRTLKIELLALYAPAVEGYLERGARFENPVLIQCMIWSFDVGDVATAVRYGGHAVERDLPMPENFRTSLRCFLADSVFDWAKAESEAGNAVEPYFTDAFGAVEQNPELYHVEIRIKYLKLAASLAAKNGDHTGALAFLRRAEAVDSRKAQVKTAIAKTEKMLAKEEHEKQFEK